MLLDYYNGRTILIPGGAGFVGTALCYKLISAASPAKIYVIIRGEEEFVKPIHRAFVRLFTNET